MRLTKLAAAAVAGCAAVVTLPGPAVAAPVQCTLVLPGKVVVDQRVEEIPVRLATDCDRNGAVAATWEITHGSGESWEFVDDEQTWTPHLRQHDDDAMGRYTGLPTGARDTAGAELAQNRPVMQVKYASRLATRATRSRTGALRWAVTASQWSGRSHRFVGRPRVGVGLFHQAPGSRAWRYVKSARTTSTGRATVTMSKPRPGLYRLMTGETPTIWAAYGKPVRGTL